MAGDDTLMCVAGRDRRRRRCASTFATWPGWTDDRASTDVDADDAADGKTLWHGRFAGGPAEALMAYTVSLPFDQRLWRDDIAGSRAHVRGLARVGLLTERRARRDPRRARRRRRRDGAAATFVFVESDEDIHTAVERRVTELAGPAGGKLHTARSRNDQVATDLRLWCKRELRDGRARRARPAGDAARPGRSAPGDVYLPGYTHLQRAQPVLLAHHLLAHGWALGRDVDRLLDTRRAALDVSPLGAGALAGSSLPIDPAGTAAELGFARAFDNSLDAVGDRDFVAEAVFDLALIGIHLVAHRRGVGAVDVGRVRLRPTRRRLCDRLVDDAAEEEPRHRRARPRQERAG